MTRMLNLADIFKLVVRIRIPRQSFAVLYTLIETCKQNGVDAYAYLTAVFTRLPTYPINRVRELLAYRWQPVAPPMARLHPSLLPPLPEHHRINETPAAYEFGRWDHR